MRFLFLSSLLCGVASAVAYGPDAALGADSAITFHDSLETARKSAADKPVVLYFSGTHCGWCRKMEADTFTDPHLKTVAADYAWVKFDVADHEELALKYRVRGIPAIVILDAKQRVLASRSGYLPTDRLLRLLQETRDNPVPQTDGVEVLLEKWKAASTPAEQEQAVDKLVMELAKSDHLGRDEILTAFATKPDVAQPLLLNLMLDPKLARRAAAFEALKQTTKVRAPFDPFGSVERRGEQLLAWRKALAP